MSTEILFTSDTHFNHKNILNFTNRPFTSIEEHDESLIQMWNEMVRPNDRVYHAGDFSFGSVQKTKEILQRLNGQIYLILGNHDNNIYSNKQFFVSITAYKEIKVDKQKIILFHYPIAEWNKAHYGSWHLYGHVHGSNNIEGKALDIGIDGPISNFKLLTFDQIRNYMKDRSIITHHNKIIQC